MQRDPVRSDWVLVGGGHTHVQVIRRFMMEPVPGVRLTVVLDRSEAVYSGMVPGLIAGDYRADELEIDVVPLARRAGARVILAPAERIDPVARRIDLAGRPALSYDLASLDVGSSVRGLDLPGVRDHALATRPIRDFIDQVEVRVERALAARGDATLRVVVVGAGAAGVELALTLEARLRALRCPAEISVMGDGPRLLPGQPARVAAQALRELAARGVRWRADARVGSVEKDAIGVDGEREPCDLAIWATGAAPQALSSASPLPVDARGFIRVRETLQVVGFDDLFAVGDCAVLDEHPWVPRAGVYAVRQGPFLDANLRARTRGRALRTFRPQRDFLALLNLGDRRALAAKWGVGWVGGWAWRLKNVIDRRFMRRFQVLNPSGLPAKGFPSSDLMGDEPMECGGCAAKLEAPRLDGALARLERAPDDASVELGLGRPDDAAAWRLAGGDLVLGTIDSFRAFTDDPWLVGRVAAVNALSDVYAMGGEPRHAMAIVSVPEEEGARAEESLFQVLSGVRAALDPLAVTLVGGHTTRGPELQVGLSVTGELPGSADRPLAISGLHPGDALILTKPLGSGVLLAADMQGRLPGRRIAALHQGLVRPNASAARVARRWGAVAATDVSGFGIARHLLEMLEASGVCARIDLDSLPTLPGAMAALAAGLRSTFHAQNRIGPDQLSFVGVAVDDPRCEILFDPQTSGGLLFAVPAARASDVVAALREAGDSEAAAIGEVQGLAPAGPRLLVEAG